MAARKSKRTTLRGDMRVSGTTAESRFMPDGPRNARRVAAALAILATANLSAAPLTATVDTSPMTMTGIGDTIAPPGATRKPLPSIAPTTGLAFTGIGDTIAPPGASRKALPSFVTTDGMTMTGTRN